MNEQPQSDFPTSPNLAKKSNQPPLTPLERLYPYQIIVYMALMGVSVLFLLLTAAYAYSAPAWQWTQFKFPKIFLVSTFVLLASSGTIYKAQQAYDKDASNELKKWITYTFGVSFLFVFLQIMGWLQLQRANVFVAGRPDASYLYLLSGLHVLHVCIGIMFLYFYRKKMMQYLNGDSVDELLFFSAPMQKINLGLLATYWHFIDILWIYLLFFFLFNHL